MDPLAALLASFREVLARPYSADVPDSSPPVIVLGVRRSGTTLLRVMLDRNAELAIPDESYFVPQLARRHRGIVQVETFVDDLRRLPTLVEWKLAPDAVALRLRPQMTTGERAESSAPAALSTAVGSGALRWLGKAPQAASAHTSSAATDTSRCTSSGNPMCAAPGRPVVMRANAVRRVCGICAARSITCVHFVNGRNSAS